MTQPAPTPDLMPCRVDEGALNPDSLKAFRRAFHEWKGSGSKDDRMVYALRAYEAARPQPTHEAVEKIREKLEAALGIIPETVAKPEGFFTRFVQHPARKPINEALALLLALAAEKPGVDELRLESLKSHCNYIAGRESQGDLTTMKTALRTGDIAARVFKPYLRTAQTMTEAEREKLVDKMLETYDLRYLNSERSAMQLVLMDVLAAIERRKGE